MNCLTLLTILTALAYTNAGTILPSAKVIQGPSSRTTLAGPDGSVISSESLGGRIIVEEKPQAVNYDESVASAPVVAQPYYAASSVVASPLLSANAVPVLGRDVAVHQSLKAGILSSSESIATGNAAIAYSSPAIIAPTAPVLSIDSRPVSEGLKSIDILVSNPSGYAAAGQTVGTHAVLGVSHIPISLGYSSPAIYSQSIPALYNYVRPLTVNGLPAQSSIDTVVAGASGSISSSKTVDVPSLPVAVSHSSSPLLAVHGAPAESSAVIRSSADSVVASSPGSVASSKSVEIPSAPVAVAYSSPVIAAHGAPIVSPTVVRSSDDTLVAGPSGSISTSKTVSTPALVAAPSVYAHEIYF